MTLKRIAELSPELPARASTEFRAAVTLIWPYSSSQRDFALLLAEPEFRLRRRKGQVRARFHGSSARALATTGVGIGDEVVLSLRGAEFVQENTVSTPGKSIDWELQYNQTVIVQVFRNGTEMANLEVVDAAPTPAPRSPVRMQSLVAPSPAQQWSSPAFLKRVRLSDGPFFEAPYDPLAEDMEDGHDRKRRRKSYRDWKAWTYSARTPSPSKDDAGDDDVSIMEVSPSRPTKLPDTPVSPSQLNGSHYAAEAIELSSDPAHDVKEIGEASSTEVDAEQEENPSQIRVSPKSKHGGSVQSNPNYDLYAGPDDIPPSEAPYAFGGDTEANTEEDEVENTDGASMSPTEPNTQDDDDEHSQMPTPDLLSTLQDEKGAGARIIRDGSSTEEDSVIEIVESQPPESSMEMLHPGTGSNRNGPPVQYGTLPMLSMPPPTLSALNTNFGAPVTPGLLTPIGREPDSPTLQPLDSATLPLPSPFPGDRDANTSSYLDHVTTSQQSHFDVRGIRDSPELPSDADYIGETSFFSSLGSSKTPANHPDHETAFTPVRFTFGLDGVGFSKPLEISSPPHEGKEMQSDSVSKPSNNAQDDSNVPEFFETRPPVVAVTRAVESPKDVATEAAGTGPNTQIMDKVDSMATSVPDNVFEVSEDPTKDRMTSPAEVIDLSSSSEAENSDNVTQEVGQEEQSDIEMIDDVEEGRPPSSQGKPVQSSKSHPERIPAPDHDHASGRVDDALEQFPKELLTSPAKPPEMDPFAEFLELSSPPHSRTVPEPHQAIPSLQDSEIVNIESQAVAEEDEKNGADAPVEPEHVSTPPVKAPEADAVPIRIEGEQFRDEEHEQSQTANPDTAMAEADEGEQPGPTNVNHEEDLHPDIKVESVEEDLPSLSQVHQSKHHEIDEGDTMLIEVPNIEHEIGEMHTVAVPATAPAKNTRSRTKTPVSPTIEDSDFSKRVIRSAKSRLSEPRNTLSPPATRKRSTISPIQEIKRTSPYSLRSQSKLLSPMESTFDAAATTPSRTRRHASNRSIGSVTDMSDRRSAERVVSESETRASRPTEMDNADPDNTELKQPPAVRGPRTRAGMKAKSKQPLTVVEANKGELADNQSSPTISHRRLRSAGSVISTVEVPPSPTMRTTRRQVSNSASSPPRNTEGQSETTPRAKRTTKLESTPRVDDGMRSSQPAYTPTVQRSPSISDTQESNARQHSAMLKSRPLTPDATQRTQSESQEAELTSQQKPALPLTPTLTQTSSALRSFNKTVRTERDPTEEASQSLSIPKSTPRRNATQTDVASPTTSREHSPASSTEKAEPAAVAMDGSKPTPFTIEQPTIGLSTPLAYYTPLKSLSYFLNRSSQFHSNSNPDILGLVTSTTTTPVRAPKGPKHWYTTLHITDASTWPQQTTVNVFRAYQSALPHADTGDVILLRAFGVKSLNRQPSLISADESAWCVWRYGKPMWNKKRGAYGEIKAREEVKGPEVERGEGEWAEVGKFRGWFEGVVKGELQEKEEGKVKTRSRGKGGEDAVEVKDEVKAEGGQRGLRSRDVGDGEENVETKEMKRVTRSQDKKT